uniref:Putative secreted protein n=1 Tax=Amblyomma triste TaxID=251400 RepID=A0A023G430_AMBTT
MRIAAVAFVCLCMVALAFAQGGSLGRLRKANPKPKIGGASGYQRLGQRPQNGRARRPSSPTSEGIPDAHPGAPGGYQLLEDIYGRPRPIGSPDLHAKRYNGRD